MRRSSACTAFAESITTFGTNTTSVRSTSAIVSCGMMLTSVMSRSGPASAATRRGTNNGARVGFSCRLVEKRPGAHSVSNTP